jgi:formate-dependent nitrite reductase cytochrome c552 subunit
VIPGRFQKRKRQRQRVDVCGKCAVERLFLVQLRGKRREWRCVVCQEKAPPLPSKMGNVPKVNPMTGRMHQSTAEAHFGQKLAQARDLGMIENVRGLDRGDPQERFRLDVYGNQAVEALLDKAERLDSLEGLCRDVRRSKTHVSNYLADFAWVSLDPAWGPVGERKVVDIKGRLAGEAYQRFLLKKALMLACHGVEVDVIDKHGRDRERR